MNRSLLRKILENSRGPIILILLVALALRLRGIDLLLPYFESGPDERFVIESALNILKTGDLNPHFFWYGSFPIYWTALLYGLVLGAWCFSPALGINWVGGEAGTIGECIKGFGIYDQGFLLFYVGRVTSIVFGLATIYLVYLLGRKLWDKSTGCLAAWFLAISPLHIYFSQLFKVDISLLFWILLTLYFSLKIYQGGTFRDYIWIGIASGLALGTKYNFIVIFPFLIILFRPGISLRQSLKMGFLTLYVVFFTFIITCPYILLDFPQFYSYIEEIVFSPGLFVYGNIRTSSSLPLWLYRLIFLFPLYFSPLIFIISFGGMAELVRSDRFRGLIFLSFPIVYYVFSSLLNAYTAPQYQFPLLPYVSLAGAAALVGIFRNRVKWVRLTAWVILLLSTVFFLSDLKYPHLNEIYRPFRDAGGWVEKNIPPGSRVLTYWWVYPPTGRFKFINESNYKKAADLSEAEVKKADPEWIVLVDAAVYQGRRRAEIFAGYNRLLQGLASGKLGDYRVRAEFSPAPLWGKLAGFIYDEFRGFRILIYQKNS
jgi:4-amino-4-deoxy-L-arabinose transferase-like glycosyltransferase